MKTSFVLGAVALILTLTACASAPQQVAGTQVAAVAVTERQCVTDRATGSNMLKKDTCNAKLVQAEDERERDRAAMDERKRSAAQPMPISK